MEPDHLIAEIYRETGISLDRGDPVLAAATVNRIMLNEAREELQRLLRASADQLSADSLQQIEAAKEAAAALITEAGTWSAQRLSEAAAEASNAVIKGLREETAKAQRAGQMAVRAAWAVAGIGGLALGAFAGFLLAMMGHG